MAPLTAGRLPPSMYTSPARSTGAGDSRRSPKWRRRLRPRHRASGRRGRPCRRACGRPRSRGAGRRPRRSCPIAWQTRRSLFGINCDVRLNVKRRIEPTRGSSRTVGSRWRGPTLAEVQHRLVLEQVLAALDRPHLPPRCPGHDPLRERHEVGERRRMYRARARARSEACGDPTLITPTLSYRAGVPGDGAPRIQETCRSARAGAAVASTAPPRTQDQRSARTPDHSRNIHPSSLCVAMRALVSKVSSPFAELAEVSDPRPEHHEALVEVKAISLNRGETRRLESMSRAPSPAGTSPASSSSRPPTAAARRPARASSAWCRAARGPNLPLSAPSGWLNCPTRCRSSRLPHCRWRG